MAKSFLIPVDLLKNEIRNVRVHNLALAPSGPVTGQIYYDTVANKLYYWNGTIWVDMSGGVTSLAGTSPIQVSSATGAVTVSILAASGSNAGSMSTTHYNLLANATSAITANTIALRDANSVFHTGTPTQDTHVVNKQYVDNLVLGLDAKASVRAASTGNITLSGTQTIDTVALSAGERVLVKDQSTPSQNGIYIVASGAWTRATDADTWAELISAYVWVEEGGTNGDTGWLCTVNAGGTLGTTAVTWVQFSGAVGITAGAGLTKTGNTIDVGEGHGMQIDADSITVKLDGSTLAKSASGLKVADGGITKTQIANNVADQSTIVGGLGQSLAVTSYTVSAGATVAKKYAFTNVSLVANTPLACSHTLNTRYLTVSVFDSTTYEEYEVDVEFTSTGIVTLTSQVNKTVNITLIG